MHGRSISQMHQKQCERKNVWSKPQTYAELVRQPVQECPQRVTIMERESETYLCTSALLLLIPKCSEPHSALLSFN